MAKATSHGLILPRRTALVAVGGVLLSACSAQGPSSPQRSQTAQEPVPTPVLGQGPVRGEAPFLLSVGEPADNATDVLASAHDVDLEVLWGVGGDYSVIASFPLSSQELFGSSSQRPDDVFSYAPALVSHTDVTALMPYPSADHDPQSYMEPQDGSSSEEWIVWRSARINSSDASAQGIDDWQVSSYDRRTGHVAELMSAQALNGTAMTPRATGETVPVVSGNTVYFSGCTINSAAATSQSPSAPGIDPSSAAWQQSLLAVAADASSEPRIIDSGFSPATLSTGVVIYVSDTEPLVPGAPGGTVLRSYDPSTGQVTDILSLDEGAQDWALTAVWAQGSHYALAVSRISNDGDTYIGLWDDTESGPQRWLYSPHPRVVMSMSEQWIAWGSGSRNVVPDMYLQQWSGGEISMIGQAIGYSRPVLAPHDDAVLVPRSDGYSPVSWQVCHLPE